METLAWWVGLGVVVVVGLLIAALVRHKRMLADAEANSRKFEYERDAAIWDINLADAGRDEALVERNEAIARRKEAADRANVLEGRVRLLESEVAGTVRRCDVEMARLRGAWEARIAELELERDQARSERNQAWVEHDRAAAEWDKQKAIADDMEARVKRQVRDMDNLADQNKQLADAHDEHGREIADLNRELDHMKSQCDGWQRGNATIAAESLAHQVRIAELEREAAEATAKGDQAHSDGWHGAKVMLISKIRKVLHEASLERAPYHVTFDERLAAFHAEPGDFGAADSEGGEA